MHVRQHDRQHDRQHGITLYSCGHEKSRCRCPGLHGAPMTVPERCPKCLRGRFLGTQALDVAATAAKCASSILNPGNGEPRLLLRTLIWKATDLLQVLEAGA